MIVIDVADHETTALAAPLMVTVDVPWLDPKLLPVRTTGVPTAPKIGRIVERTGMGSTVKLWPLDVSAPTVTVIFPVVAPVGTVTPIEAADQDVGVAGTPLNETTLVPWVAPKFVPAITTDCPTNH